MESEVPLNGSNLVEFYTNPNELSQIISNLRNVGKILDTTSSSDKFLGLSFKHINNLMKARELIREVAESLHNPSDKSFNSYDSRTYKKKRW